MAAQIDRSKAETEEAKEALDSLWTLAESKYELFKLTITDSLKNAEHNKTLPITAIIKQRGQIRAYVSKDKDNIDKIIDDVSSIFIGTGNTASAIANIAKSVIGAFLGTSSGSESQDFTYAAYTDGIALLRFDLMAWKRNVKATSLLDRVESVSAYYYTVSVVDVKKIDFPTFLASYQKVLSNMLPPPTHSEIITMIDELKEIYERLSAMNELDYQELMQKSYKGLKAI